MTWLLTLLLVAQHVDWLAVGNDRGGMRYSTLDEIDRENVERLEVAWTWHTDELEGRRGKTIECTPIVIDGVMYVSTAYLRVAALDAATGEEKWAFDPMAAPHEPIGPLASGGVNRGVAWWSDGKPDGERRILHGCADGRLFSLDARTGKPDPAFGQGGFVDLRRDITRDISRMPYGPTSPPAICGDVVILGFSTGEGPGPAAPGDVRAFDVRTGKQVWRFHTVPRPGEFGNDTWAGDSWKNRGGANAWGGFSVDVKRGWVFFGLGAASFDFYGGDRHGQNLFANSTVALDARTGERRWHFQTVHHDLWDFDVPVYPNLITVTRDGRQVEAAAQVTKTGYVFLFDRQPGEPLFEVEERPVPPSDVPGEQAWPTQPVPVKPGPFSRVAHDGTASFTPPSLEGALCIPGFHGGATWSGASYDPTTGLLYVNTNDQPNVITLVEAPAERRYRYGVTGYHRLLDENGRPGLPPPWGRLHAIDMNTGAYAWSITLGAYPELTEQGVPPTGCENFGGTIVTAGGLVFIGGTRDEKFHAFDKATGELLWEAKLPAGGYATPSTYRASGRQYVVIAAGGAGKIGTRAGDAFVAFALSPQIDPTD